MLYSSTQVRKCPGRCQVEFVFEMFWPGKKTSSQEPPLEGWKKNVEIHMPWSNPSDVNES